MTDLTLVEKVKYVKAWVEWFFSKITDYFFTRDNIDTCYVFHEGGFHKKIDNYKELCATLFNYDEVNSIYLKHDHKSILTSDIHELNKFCTDDLDIKRYICVSCKFENVDEEYDITDFFDNFHVEHFVLEEIELLLELVYKNIPSDVLCHRLEYIFTMDDDCNEKTYTWHHNR